MEELLKQIEDFTPFDDKEQADKEVMIEYIKTHKDVLTRDDKIAHMTTSGWIVNKERTKVLMIYHNIYDSWAWVGGHADGDSDLFHVVKKEIEEETGVTEVKPLQEGIYGLNIVTVESHIKRGKRVNAHLHFDIEYLVEADENSPLRMKEDENSGVEWVPIEEVETKTNEEKMKPIYHRLNEKLKNIK